MNARTTLCTVLMLGMPAVAWPQVPATTFDGLGALVRAHETLTVTDAQGATIRGRIASICGDTLEIKIEGQPVRLNVSQVQRVSAKRRDSLVDGALVGFGVGAGMGTLLARSSGGDGWIDLRDLAVRITLSFGAIGLGLGTVLDLTIKKPRVIYERPGAGDNPRIAIAPVAVRRGIGAVVVVRR